MVAQSLLDLIYSLYAKFDHDGWYRALSFDRARFWARFFLTQRAVIIAAIIAQTPPILDPRITPTVPSLVRLLDDDD